MAARAEGFPLPHAPLGRVLKPLLGSALLATLVAMIRRIAREPSVPPMSEQWMQNHIHDYDQPDY